MFALSSSPTNGLPALAPPYGEIPPTFWQQHGTAAVIGGAVILAMAGAGAWLLFRPKPPKLVPPEVAARDILFRLRGQPEDGNTLTEVSRALQHYLEAVLYLPRGEMTTTELSRVLAESEMAGAGVAQTVSSFLRECDQRKFSNAAPRPPLNAAERAWEIILEIEKQRAEFAVKVTHDRRI